MRDAEPVRARDVHIMHLERNLRTSQASVQVVWEGEREKFLISIFGNGVLRWINREPPRWATKAEASVASHSAALWWKLRDLSSRLQRRR